MSDKQAKTLLYGHFSSLPTGTIVLALNMTGTAFSFVEVDVLGGAPVKPQMRANNFSHLSPIFAIATPAWISAFQATG